MREAEANVNSKNIMNITTKAISDCTESNQFIESRNFSEIFGGRLKFFKDGKFIFELEGAKDGERTGWVSVPRKKFWSTSANLSSSRKDSTNSLSISDDNSSIPSSPWQREHCWKQSSPRRCYTSEEMNLFYYKPQRINVTNVGLRISRIVRRKPFCDVQVSNCTILNNSSTITIPSNNYSQILDASFMNDREILISYGNQSNTRNANARKSLNIIVNKLKTRISEKLTFIRKNNIPGNTVYETKYALVSPRKRILRELEKVSLEDSNNMKRSRAKNNQINTGNFDLCPTNIKIDDKKNCLEENNLENHTMNSDMNLCNYRLINNVESKKSTNYILNDSPCKTKKHSISTILNRDKSTVRKENSFYSFMKPSRSTNENLVNNSLKINSSTQPKDSSVTEVFDSQDNNNALKLPDNNCNNCYSQCSDASLVQEQENKNLINKYKIQFEAQNLSTSSTISSLFIHPYNTFIPMRGESVIEENSTKPQYYNSTTSSEQESFKSFSDHLKPSSSSPPRISPTNFQTSVSSLNNFNKSSTFSNVNSITHLEVNDDSMTLATISNIINNSGELAKTSYTPVKNESFKKLHASKLSNVNMQCTKKCNRDNNNVVASTEVLSDSQTQNFARQSYQDSEYMFYLYNPAMSLLDSSPRTYLPPLYYSSLYPENTYRPPFLVQYPTFSSHRLSNQENSHLSNLVNPPPLAWHDVANQYLGDNTAKNNKEESISDVPLNLSKH